MMLMMQAAGASIISIIGGPFLKLRAFRYPPNLQKWCSGPDGPRRLVFKTVCADDAHFEGLGTPKMLQKSFRAAGIRFQNPCQFWSDLGRGVREGPLEKRRSNDAGSAALASAPWQSQGHGLRRQPEGVARFPKGFLDFS